MCFRDETLMTEDSGDDWTMAGWGSVASGLYLHGMQRSLERNRHYGPADLDAEPRWVAAQRRRLDDFRAWVSVSGPYARADCRPERRPKGGLQ